jgi:hypothetical protein
MSSFPLIKDLPSVLDSVGWTWERYRTPSFLSDDFWIGTDRSGDKWLTKLRGDFYAYREIVFARLAQTMGWSCQSSAFLRISAEDAKILGASSNEVHAAHWFMEEHARDAGCSHSCAFEFLLGRSLVTVDDFKGSNIAHLLDWPKSNFAACLFGANEPPDGFITREHEFVIIDSEQMFSTGPCELSGTAWWNLPDGSPSPVGRALALEVCRDVASLSSDELNDALAIPTQVTVRQRWPIAPLVQASHALAVAYVAKQRLLRPAAL